MALADDTPAAFEQRSGATAAVASNTADDPRGLRWIEIVGRLAQHYGITHSRSANSYLRRRRRCAASRSSPAASAWM